MDRNRFDRSLARKLAQMRASHNWRAKNQTRFQRPLFVEPWMTETVDKLEAITIEGKVVLTLQTALREGPEAAFAKEMLTVLGHALVDKVGPDHLGDVLERIVRLDPANTKARHDVLEDAWESVGREGDEHWS